MERIVVLAVLNIAVMDVLVAVMLVKDIVTEHVLTNVVNRVKVTVQQPMYSDL